MPELDFPGLREYLARQAAAQPPFADIRDRRRRRTRRWAVAVATAVVVGLLTATTVLAGYPRRAPVPPAQSPTPAHSAQILQPEVSAVAFSPDGTLYAATIGCPVDCARDLAVSVSRSTDLGATWSVTPVPVTPPVVGVLFAPGGARLWSVNQVEVSGSTDAGATWTRWVGIGANSTDRPAHAGMAGGTLWVAQNGAVGTATAEQVPAPTPAQPPGLIEIRTLAALGPDRAAVLTGDTTGTWYQSTDRGRHWSVLADPCAGTPYPGALDATMSAGPDGTMWAVCTGSTDGTGAAQPKVLVRSTDGGATWGPATALDPAGVLVEIVPVSATTAWLTGLGGDLYRTTDAGAHWNRVAATADPARPLTLAVRDADTAAYTRGTAVVVTRDGGRTWTEHPVPTR